MTAALIIAALTAAGVFLVLQRGIVRMAIGFVLMQHAVNVLLVATGPASHRSVPIAPFDGPPADPLGHALALTAIVIGLATTVFLLAVALRRVRTAREDEVEPGP